MSSIKESAERLDAAAKRHKMSDDEIQWMLERAAIIEIMGGRSAGEADARAIRLTVKKRKDDGEERANRLGRT